MRLSPKDLQALVNTQMLSLKKKRLKLKLISTKKGASKKLNIVFSILGALFSKPWNKL